MQVWSIPCVVADQIFRYVISIRNMVFDALIAVWVKSALNYLWLRHKGLMLILMLLWLRRLLKIGKFIIFYLEAMLYPLIFHILCEVPIKLFYVNVMRSGSTIYGHRWMEKFTLLQ